jgi:hypothetical protein
MDAEDGYQAATPAASSASALNAPSHTHSGPSPSGSAAFRRAAGGRSRHGCSVGRPGTQGAVGEVWTHWSGLTRCRGICRELSGSPGGLRGLCGGWRRCETRCPTGWRPPVGRLAFLFFAPPGTRCFHISPGAAGKADESAGSHRDAQAPLVARAVEGTSRPHHMTAYGRPLRLVNMSKGKFLLSRKREFL